MNAAHTRKIEEFEILFDRPPVKLHLVPPREKYSVSILARLFFILLVPTVVGIVTYRYFSSALLEASNPNSKNKIKVEILPGSTLEDVAKNLHGLGLIKNYWSLIFLEKIQKLDFPLEAGEYEFSASMSPKDILSRIVAAETIRHRVEIKAGTTIKSMAEQFDQSGVVSKQEFIRAAYDPELLARAGISSSSFEGYLNPGNYEFSKNNSADEIVWRLFTENEKLWNSDFQMRADLLNLSRHEILTIASIIEKEAFNSEEYALISSVIHNRLRRGLRLQLLSAVTYGIPNFDGNLRRADMQRPGNYNTFVNFGLPIGPITNPGKSAIFAALFPKETAFLSFVDNKQGAHIFSLS